MDQKIFKDKLTIQINMLENYVRAKKIEDFNILSFLFDLKELKPNLKISYIYKRFQKEYYDENDLDKVNLFYKKSVKIFEDAKIHIKTNQDKTLDKIIDSINDTIIQNYKHGYKLFKMEYQV